MHIIQLSSVLQSKVVQVIFSYLSTYTDGSVAEFPVLINTSAVSQDIYKGLSHQKKVKN